VSLAILLPFLVVAVAALAAAVVFAVREHRRARTLADELQTARTEATLLERRDDDTGLWNSRFFVEALTREIERSRTYDRPVALALASVDDVSADEVEASMRTLGAAIGGSVRALDVACRVGTTEFGVIMPETDSRSASVASERVLRAIARARTEGGSTPQAAVGIAQVGLDGRWLHVNTAICRITGYTAEHLARLRFHDITQRKFHSRGSSRTE